MAKKKGGLGKGLDVLIRNKSASNKIQKEMDADKGHVNDSSDKSLETKDAFKENSSESLNIPFEHTRENSETELFQSNQGDANTDNSHSTNMQDQNGSFDKVQDENDYFNAAQDTNDSSNKVQEEINSFSNVQDVDSPLVNGLHTNDSLISGEDVIDSSLTNSQVEIVEQLNVNNQDDKSNNAFYKEDINADGEKVLIMKISAVEPNRDQPRKSFREEGIDELASSIAQYGIIQPLLVQKRDDYYEIIAGERRWRAAMKAGLKEVPVIVKDYSNREAVEISLIENIQREDLNPIEEALAYERLITEFEMTQEEVAGRVSKSRSAVTNSLRLLRLEGDIRQMVILGELSEGHARTLLGLPNEEMQKLLAERIIKEKLSVRDTERLVKKLTESKPKKTKEKDYQKEAILNNLSEQLKNTFGTKVSIIEKSRSRGKIEIEYYSDDELNRIFEMLQSVR